MGIEYLSVTIDLVDPDETDRFRTGFGLLIYLTNNTIVSLV